MLQRRHGVNSPVWVCGRRLPLTLLPVLREDTGRKLHTASNPRCWVTEVSWCRMEANWVKALFEPRRRREEEAVTRYKHSCFSTFHLYLPLPASPSRSARPSSRLSATEQPIVPVCRCHGARELSVAHDDLSSFICSDFIYYFSSMFAACPLLKDREY